MVIVTVFESAVAGEADEVKLLFGGGDTVTVPSSNKDVAPPPDPQPATTNSETIASTHLKLLNIFPPCIYLIF
ncbi:MAG: hypothetical protein A2079_06080 [Geobacteraceae bacterium GWC2_48_7]|nr:MAG: hypothetical protein A2X80_00475 [Geobacteraceae bacterium GWB2_52_12]OGT98058.1 MAG: hypothetical protein A2079_06080 [Geobacteraceae bacterium GWC2_48_7]